MVSEKSNLFEWGSVVVVQKMRMGNVMRFSFFFGSDVNTTLFPFTSTEMPIRCGVGMKLIVDSIHSFQYINEFLKDLPSHNEQNFALFNTENGIRTSSRRPPVYLPTEDIPSEQSMTPAHVNPKKFLLNRPGSNHSFRFPIIYSYRYGEKEYFAAIFASTVGEEGEWCHEWRQSTILRIGNRLLISGNDVC